MTTLLISPIRRIAGVMAASCCLLMLATACNADSSPTAGSNSGSATNSTQEPESTGGDSSTFYSRPWDSSSDPTNEHGASDAQSEAAEPPTAPESASLNEDALNQSVEQTRQLLASLPVKGRAPMTGYTREFFGQAWTDDVTVEYGHNGCDTRNDILRRDLTNIEFKPNTNGCVAKSGTLADPYSNKEISFVRGNNSSAVQIDHVVALADAYQKGAQAWNEQIRKNFANDPLNLLAVDGPLNQQKGAGDAATWLPPAKSYRCKYATRQILVKAKYQVWVTQAEQEALARQLDTCSP